MATNVGSATGYLDLDISGFLAGLQSAQTAANTQTRNMATTVGKNLSGIGSSLTSVGTTLTKTVTVPLAGIGAIGLKTAMNFEKGMSEVRAISGATGKDFDNLRNKAIDLGATTAFSAGEVAAAMTEMAKAGWDSQQVIDGMGGVLDAAAASGEGLAAVATIVADAITGFGMQASESTKVADLLTQAANSGTIGITDLGESFKYIAPIAGSMGLSIEDVTTAIAAMSMAGIKGSSAGTALRTMLTNLVNPAGQAVKAIEELEISAVNADGSMKSLDEIVSMLRTSFDGLTESEKSQYAAMLAGQEGMSGLLSLLNLTEEEYNAIAESMDNANGVAQETATIMQDNLQSKVEQLVGSLESLAIKLGDIVIPYVQQFVLWLTSLVDKFTNLDTETQKTILKFAALAAVIGPLVLVFGTMISALGTIFTTFGKIPGLIKTVTTGFTNLTNSVKRVGDAFRLAKAGYTGFAAEASKIGAALAGVTAPMIAIVAVIATVTAAFISLWKNNEEFREKVTAIWEQIQETFNDFAQGIIDRINSLGFEFASIAEVFGSVIGTLRAIWQGFTDFLAPVFIGAFQQVQIALQTVLNVILGIFDFWIAVFKGNWQGAWDAVQGIFVSVWNGIISTFQNVGNMLLGVLNVVLGWFGTSWQEAWTSISVFFTDVWNNITSFFTGVWEGIKNVVKLGLMFIVSLIDTYFQLITLPFAFIWENCKETITSVWESIKTTISNTLGIVNEVITSTWTQVKGVFDSIWNQIAAFISSIWGSMKITIASSTNSIKNTISSVWNSVSTMTTSIWNSVKTVISTNINSAKDTISSVVNLIKSTISSGFNDALNTVTNIFTSIKNTISNMMDSAVNIVKSGVEKLKAAFNFEWSLPKIKLPHFSISGGFSLNPPSVPSFSVSWYKKAMLGGMILNSPTIFGFDPSTGKFLGGGEAGSETIVGTSNLMKMIRSAVDDAIRPMIDATYQLTKVSHELGYITNNAFARQTQVFEEIVKNRSGETGNGDTYNFYSPKAIDEIEAAKQMKTAKRDLAEGF